MTTYGTIPTSTSPNLEYISRAKARLKSTFSTRRPWKLMFDIHSLKIPSPFISESLTRLRKNTLYFRVNYAIMMLLILFVSLIWHPISMLVFLAMMAAWLFLYFMRDEPLVLMNKVVDDRIVLGVLSVVTFVVLLLTHVTGQVLISLAVGVVVVVVHAVLRRSDDLPEDDGDGDDEYRGGLMTATSSS